MLDNVHSMRLILVAPRLLSQPPDALAAVGELSRLSVSPRESETDLDRALLVALHSEAAVAPLAALGAGVPVGSRFVMRADPVSMSVMRDDVQIDGRVDDLDEGEATRLMRLMNEHFSSDGLEFIAARHDEWFVATERAFDVSTSGLDASIARPLRDRLPVGPDSACWRRWFTEAQMLLFEHPLTERVTRPVNAIWFSEGGTLPSRLRNVEYDIHAADERPGDVARGIAKLGGKSSTLPSSLPAPTHPAREMITVAESISSTDRLAQFVRAWLAPALQLLDAKRIAELVVIADGRGTAACWNVARRGWLDRLRSRGTPFAMPTS